MGQLIRDAGLFDGLDGFTTADDCRRVRIGHRVGDGECASGEARIFEHAHRAVPQHGSGLADSGGELFVGGRIDVVHPPPWRDGVARHRASGRIGLELLEVADFGQVAAANALSDVYAMGGQPMTALNIVAFPTSQLPLEVLTEILAGGQDKVHEAGALVVGGHTVVDTELKYGLAVTGRAHPNFLLTNAGAKAGDQIVITKPIGNGILATAGKAGHLKSAAERAMLETMKTLNGGASRAALAVGSKCATDITGFGLLGHLSHIARASNVSLRLDLGAVPILPDVREAVRAGFVTDFGWSGRLRKARAGD